MIKPVVPLLVLALLLWGCTEAPQREDTNAARQAFGSARPGAVDAQALARFEAAWAGYVAELGQDALQFGCRPRRYRPPADVERRGVVVAFHGFSACGQQYFQLAPLLAERGFDVLVPMLPGHGLLPGPDGEEDLSSVPTAKNWASAYGGLAAEMNRIVHESPGERILVGYSLGGTLAINAAHRAPGIYDRMLLIAPLTAIRGGAFVEGLGDYLGRVPGTRNWRVKPGGAQKACEAWTEAGRAGFCDYRLEHVPALVRLQRQNREWGRAQPLTLPVQVILADADKVVSNGATEQLVEEQRGNGPIASCILAGGVPHEVLTPYENVGREMVWLGTFLDYAVGFVVEARLIDCA